MNSRRRRVTLLSGVMVPVLSLGFLYLKRRFLGNAPLWFSTRLDAPTPLAHWPWPKVRQDTPHRGVTHWLARAPDGTVVELFKFDFNTNPHMRFEIYDQDEDDKTPFDNKVSYWPLGVGQAARHLNELGRGQVVAAWNGIFFNYDKAGPGGTAHHVSPVVLQGKPHYYGSIPNYRWMFGVKYRNGRPTFQVFYKPDEATAGREFDFAAASAQCLIKAGAPLRLQPFPRRGEAPMKQPVPSTAQEAGHIPLFDHIKTCRASLAWTKDSRQLYLLFVKEADSEAASILALRAGLSFSGGWTVADVQRFWQSMKVWTVINSDAGDVAQLTYLRPDGKYELIPSRKTSDVMRMTCDPDFKNAPQGGSLTYFFVRDAAQ